jgi:cation diffusion facilitator CzcD-associated flavoprotein CzcO
LNFAKKYDLGKYVRLNSVVKSARWVEEDGRYELEVSQNDGGSSGSPMVMKKTWCHVLINATGILNNWKWPDIPGLHDFRGTLLHSANWDTTTRWDDKTVAVIGTGSSAIQILPQIQPTAKSLVTFMRSVTWIAPPIAEDMLRKAIVTTAGAGGAGGAVTNDKTTTVATAAAAALGAQYLYTDEEKRRFRDNPAELLAYRKELEARFNTMFDVFRAGSDASKSAQTYMREEMLRRIGPGHEDLKTHLIPTWPPGCRRMTPGDGYLEALTRDNVTRVYDEIVRVTPEGLVDGAGRLHEVDIIVAATGFDVTFKPSFQVLGVEGADMHREFTPFPQVYLSMATPKFPNYFTINGFRGSWATGTALNSQEACVEYILQCVRRIQGENIRALEVRPEPIHDLYEHTDEWHKRSVWNAECKR